MLHGRLPRDIGETTLVVLAWFLCVGLTWRYSASHTPSTRASIRLLLLMVVAVSIFLVADLLFCMIAPTSLALRLLTSLGSCSCTPRPEPLQLPAPTCDGWRAVPHHIALPTLRLPEITSVCRMALPIRIPWLGKMVPFGGPVGWLYDGPDTAVCADAPRLRPAGQCVAYQFGIGSRWGFALALSHAGCRVYAFDPDPQPTPPRSVTFEQLGIGTSNRNASGREHAYRSNHYKIRTLQALMKRYNHSFIDVLRIDVEGAEWPLIKSFAASGILTSRRVGQVLFELHGKETANAQRHLEQLGLRPFHAVHNCMGGDILIEVATFTSPHRSKRAGMAAGKQQMGANATIRVLV